MYACCSGVVILVLCELLSEGKVDVSQCINYGVDSPHCSEDMSHQVEIFINGTLEYFLNSSFQEARTDPFCEDMEDGEYILNVVKVGMYTDPGGEFSPLTPGGLVFLELVF